MYDFTSLLASTLTAITSGLDLIDISTFIGGVVGLMVVGTVLFGFARKAVGLVRGRR